MLIIVWLNGAGLIRIAYNREKEEKALKEKKTLVNVIKKVPIASKKMIPLAGKLAGNVLKSLDLLEHTSKIAKPFVDDFRTKSIENSKKIFATQVVIDDEYVIEIKSADLKGTGQTQEEALNAFMRALIHLWESQVLSPDKKIRKEQLKLISKMSAIADKSDNLCIDLKRYIFRIHYPKT